MDLTLKTLVKFPNDVVQNAIEMNELLQQGTRCID